MRKKIVYVVVFLMCLTAVVVASWLTTAVYWDADWPVGEWVILVRDAEGVPIPGVRLSVRSSETGEFIRGPFENYSGPESLVSDAEGRIQLYNRDEGFWGGHYWKLFWIWPIGRAPGPLPINLHISSDGHEAVVLPAEELFTRGTVIVTLYSKSRHTRGSK